MYKTSGKNIQRNRVLSRIVAPSKPLPRSPLEIKIEELEKELRAYRNANEHLRNKLNVSSNNVLLVDYEKLKRENLELRQHNDELKRSVELLRKNIIPNLFSVDNQKKPLISQDKPNNVQKTQANQKGIKLGSIVRIKGDIKNTNKSDWQKSLEKYVNKSS